MKRVLMIDDDLSLQRLVKKNFEPELNIQFEFAPSYFRALAMIQEQDYALFLLDLNLNGESGLDLMRAICKEENLYNRVIVISSDIKCKDQLEGYKLGVSNFVLKPIDFEILRAIMKKNLAMFDSVHLQDIQFGPLLINQEKHLCTIKHNSQVDRISLTLCEFQILYALLKQKGGLVTKDHLLNMEFSNDKTLSQSALDVHISHIRKKLTPYGVKLKTKWGVGYYLELIKLMLKAS